MASLIEELINILEEEYKIYSSLIPIANEKTQVIVDNNIAALQEITAKEQKAIDKITALEHKRGKVMEDIKTVLGKKGENLNLKALIELLKGQEKEQKVLAQLHDKLKDTVNYLAGINNRNKSLIEQSLEMIDFNMNFLQSLRMLPGNNTYNKYASQNYDEIPGTGMFDAKQ